MDNRASTPDEVRAADAAPALGIFDSGVGGLSVTREILAQLPAQPILYLADQAHAPYGDRSLPEIRALSEGITRFLLEQGARIIVIACNTASAAALHWLRARRPDVPFVGMEPAVKPAALRTATRHVGVLATSATFQGELFASLLDRYASDVTVHAQVCPDLVPLIEAGELDSPRTRRAVETYLAPLLAAQVDTLVLGCTHYPFVRALIEEVAGPGVEVIDPAPAVARQTGRVLARHGWLADSAAPARHRFYTTGNPADLSASLATLLAIDADVAGAAWADGRIALAAHTPHPAPIAPATDPGP